MSTPAPQGADLTPPHLPGFEPIFLAIVQSFVKGKSPADLTDEVMDAILAQSEKFTNKILAKYPSVLPVVLPSKPLPSGWKAGAETAHAPIPEHWVKQAK